MKYSGKKQMIYDHEWNKNGQKGKRKCENAKMKTLFQHSLHNIQFDNTISEVAF